MSDNYIYTPLTTAYMVDSMNEERLKDMKREQRVQMISDMYGAKAPSFDEFRQKTGMTTKIGKAILAAAVGAAVIGGIASLAGVIGGALALVTVVGGVVGAALSASHDTSKAEAAYDGFMGDFAREARGQHEAKMRQQTIEAVQTATQGNAKQWAEAVEQKRKALEKQPHGIG